MSPSSSGKAAAAGKAPFSKLSYQLPQKLRKEYKAAGECLTSRTKAVRGRF
jgi:hypothetical protein